MNSEEHEVWCKYNSADRKHYNKTGETQRPIPDINRMPKALYFIGPGPLPVMFTRQEVERMAQKGKADVNTRSKHSTPRR